MKTKIVSIPKDIFEKNFNFQNGGVKQREQIHKSLTGEYAFGVDSNQVNAELESGEYLQDSSGIKQVEGKKHSQGGEKMALEDGTRILSDYLKLGAKNAKILGEEIGLELKATDTYSTVLDKFNKKSGLDDLNEELEEYIADLDKQQQNTKDEATLALNTQYLTEEINEIAKKKQPLDEVRARIFDLTFNTQEASKPKEDSREEFQTGGTMTYNGDTIVQLAKKYDIDEERANSLLKKYQTGAIHRTPMLTREQQAERLKDFEKAARFAGYEGAPINYEASDYGAEVYPLQKWAVENRPDDVYSYYTKSGQPLNASHVDIFKKDFPAAFKATGLNINKSSAEFTSEEKKKLQDYLYNLDDAENKATYKDTILKGFPDRKFDWRHPEFSINHLSAAPVVKNPIVPTAFNIGTLEAPPKTTSSVAPTNESYTSSDKVKAPSSGGSVLSRPDQWQMTPEGQMPHLKPNRRFETIDPVMMSPERQLAEISRQVEGAKANIAMLPDQQAAAALASISASSAEASNKAISDITRANTASQDSANRFNAQTRQNEENAAWQDALSYERNTYLAKANTDQSWRNYYDRENAKQVDDWKYIEMLNRYNALNPEVQYTPEGYVVTSPKFKDNPTVEKLINAANTSTENMPPRTVKKKKAGGRFKK